MSFRFLYQQMNLEMQKKIELGNRLATDIFTYIEASPFDPQEGGRVKTSEWLAR